MLRRFQLLLTGSLLLIAALSTGAQVLYFLFLLGAIVTIASWLMTRLALGGLEAGFTLDRPQAQVGDHVRALYTIRDRRRLPRPWIEVQSASTLPVPIPGRAIGLGPGGRRSWSVEVPLPRRGHFRVDPMTVRAGDPFGLFSATARVGAGAEIVVYPAEEPLPAWRLPPALIEGSDANPQRTRQASQLVTGVRPYVTGDAFNRIHWRSTARQGELQVKEFDVEQTADLWLFLDLDRRAQAGADATATVETAVTACASVMARVLSGGRSVGLEAAGTRRHVLPADRGARQQMKILHLLASVAADGAVPIGEVLVDGLARLRRGTTAVIVTPSIDRAWVGRLAPLRGRGIGCTVIIADPVAHEAATRAVLGEPPLTDAERTPWEHDLAALRADLAELEIPCHVIRPGVPLAGQIVTAAGRQGAGSR